MACPKKRTTSAKRDMRRSKHFLKPLRLLKCPKCGEMIVSHKTCPFCGYYAGRMVIDVAAKLTKREKKRHEKEMAKKEAAAKKSASASATVDKEKKEAPKPLSIEELSKKQ